MKKIIILLIVFSLVMTGCSTKNDNKLTKKDLPIENNSDDENIVSEILEETNEDENNILDEETSEIRNNLLLEYLSRGETNDEDYDLIEEDFDDIIYNDYNLEDDSRMDLSLVGYTNNGTPVFMGDDNIDWKYTVDSDCFSKIGYDDDENILYLVFRRNKAQYRYLNFYSLDWFDFSVYCDSKDKYYVQKIKGEYPCEKLGIDGEYYRTIFEEEYDYIKVIGYTSIGTPIIEDPEEDVYWKNTYDSDCFKKIGYVDDLDVLYVIFRDTGDEYRYVDVPYYRWLGLRTADSHGEYYNDYIKGKYICQKVDPYSLYIPDYESYYEDAKKEIEEEYEIRREKMYEMINN